LLPSDVHRILASLQSCGYIEQDRQTKRYRLGCGLVKLSLTTCQRMSLREVGRPLLKRISEELDSSAHMAMFDDRELEVFLVDQIDYPGEILIRPRFGLPSGPHCTALGKTIMACTDEQTSFHVVKKSGMPRLTVNTVTDFAALALEFARIRQQGYAIDHEESVEGACCIGAPVRDCTGTVIASISASMMSQRFYRWNEARLVSVMKSAAAELSAGIGYEGAAPTGLPQPRQPYRRGQRTLRVS
jgi:DNA-binding IclR family transcriptional regulator